MRRKLLRQIWFDGLVASHRFRSWRLPWALLEFRSFPPLGRWTRRTGGSGRRTSRISIPGKAATSIKPFCDRCTRVTIACLFWLPSTHNKLLRLLLRPQIRGRIGRGWASLRPSIFDLLFVGRFLDWKLHNVLLLSTRARLQVFKCACCHFKFSHIFGCLDRRSKCFLARPLIFEIYRGLISLALLGIGLQFPLLFLIRLLGFGHSIIICLISLLSSSPIRCRIPCLIFLLNNFQFLYSSWSPILHQPIRHPSALRPFLFWYTSLFL